MIFIFLPFFLFAGVIENNISKVYKDIFPNIKINSIILKNNKNITPPIHISMININPKRQSGTIKVNNKFIFYKILAQIQVLKSTSAIKKNERVNNSNAKLVWINFKNFYSYPMTSFSNEVAKLYIPKNRIIYEYMLKKKNIIKRNQTINIITSSGNIEVQFQAIAQQNGEVGDTIKVKKDKKTFFVTIDKNGNGRL